MHITGGKITCGLAALLLLLTACEEKKQEPTVMSVSDTLQPAVEVKADSTDTTLANAPKIDTTLLPVSREILKLVKEKNYAGLSKYVHPKDGVRFSPYAYVYRSHCRFTAKQLSGINVSKVYTWGNHSGSGDPIRLTVPEYFERFVYDTDFLNNAQISQNEVLGSSTTSNNIGEIYPGCSFTEFHFKGTEEHHKMDWSSVRLVFKMENDQPYLVAIVHDQWTV